jgi:hypothetical protein
MSQDFSHLNNDQRAVINMYLTQYSEISNQINNLLEAQSNIRSIINSLVFNRGMRYNYSNRNISRNNYYNSYPSSNLRENRQVFYDYDNPINPLSYISPMVYTDNYRNGVSNLLNSFLNSSVPIYPTEQQIEHSTRLVRYSEINNPITDTCPISLERFNNNDNVRQIHHCGHIFSDTALNEWFRSNVRCPVCRYDIRNYNSNNTQSNTSEINDVNMHQTDDDVQEQSINDTSNTNTNTNTNTRPSSNRNTNISNINYLRNPVSNIIEQVEFDIENDELVNNLLSYATNLVSNSNTTNNNTTNNNTRTTESTNRINSAQNQRFLYDPSLNVLLFETFLRPSRRP